MSNMIEIKALHKSYGSRKVLNNVSLTLESGTIVGLLGPNGCGKTSLIKIIAGIIQDYEGKVMIDGRSPDEYTKSIVSYLPEKTYLGENLKAKDALDFFEDFYSDFDREKASKMLSQFKLDPNQKIKSMSKGMQEKVQLILVMSRKAKVYLLDEPLGGLDPASRKAMLDIILNNYSEDAVVLLSTHLINDVERIFDRVIMVGESRILIDDTVDNIREKNGKSVEELFEEVFKC
ncbi:ABC transporter related protein [Ruminiclostridium papyrosolvens DSM 2782]|uniref:ABC transporter related protein n=1 Tax=Ruminiclostridium papyrosolvens DSM 2782 TaxID=588581 RepID=F1TAL8_9FIRM|nr:ABC transporter ATP-binding protein [Ruminiclostridium papyrosolvens]EGD48561.1 ABC transporter related protein [Ruminiclostridium papyrosolvens DSM 2782]WES32683.1 ABC transporter ATP-binding protein [Ruminiclostridium papyrosolvens DSM 2782]